MPAGHEGPRDNPVQVMPLPGSNNVARVVATTDAQGQVVEPSPMAGASSGSGSDAGGFLVEPLRYVPLEEEEALGAGSPRPGGVVPPAEALEGA